MSRMRQRVFVLTLMVVAMLTAPVIAVTFAYQWRQSILGEASRLLAERSRLIETTQDLRQQISNLHSNRLDFQTWGGVAQVDVAVQVQDTLVQHAVATEVNFRAMSPIEAALPPGVSGVGYRIEAEANLEQAILLIAAVESNEPPLLISRAVLRRLSRGSDSATLPIVLLQIDVSAVTEIVDVDYE